MPSVYGKPNPSSNSSVRLNRYLASCGLGSRRTCDRLIADGQVMVDGSPVASMGVTVFPFRSRVEVYGREVRPESTRVLMVHKPRNVICTVSDPEDRKTVLDLLPDTWKDLRLYPVGRLDRNSEGLILVTNDGDLANRLTHPRYHVEKEYLVWVREELTEEQGGALLDGVRDDGEVLRALAITPIPSKGRFHCYSMILGEGRNRQIRRMCEAVDVSVVRIKRIRMAGLDIQEVPVGECRELVGRELADLRKAVGLS
ncbi:MAG: pseudouridine synthase [Kiritimatiellae bacterium]|nr:pseudouridine synthase [Kiritimatiellia bacterium]